MKYTIKKLKRLIKKIPEGYTGNTNYLKEHGLRCREETLIEVLKKFLNNFITSSSPQCLDKIIGYFLNKLEGKTILL